MIRKLACCATLVLAAAANANPAHRILESMSEDQRRTTLAGFLRSSGEQCPAANRTFFRGLDRTRGLAHWSVQCTNGKAFMISFENDAQGSSKLLDCAFLRAVAKDDCFARLK